MQLSDKQLKWLNNELKVLKRIIESKPEKGIFRLVARQETLLAIRDLHKSEKVEA